MIFSSLTENSSMKTTQRALFASLLVLSLAASAASLLKTDTAKTSIYVRNSTPL